MDDDQFRLWAQLLEQRMGIALPQSRRSFLVTSLGPRMHELGIVDYQSFYDYITAGRQGTFEWECLVDRLTVHETWFFRNEDTLRLLREVYLPPRLAQTGEALRLDVWSVGCATGEEPYSLAMVLDQALLASNRDYYLGVTATDVSLPSLSIGRRAVYPRAKLKHVPAALLMRYFTPMDEQHFQINARLRQRVCFTRLNVIDADYGPVGLMDVIVCQNLLIYFRREQRITALNRMVEHLRPGGMLILGAGEIRGWAHAALEPVVGDDTLAFRRIASSGGEE